MKQETSITTSQYREAIGAYPAWLDNPDVLKGYNAMAKASDSQEDIKKIKSHLQTLDPKKHSEELFVNGYRIAKDMGDTVLYTSIRKKLDKMNPNSLVTQEEHSISFTKAQLLEEKVNIRNDFKTKYVINDQNRSYLDRMTASLAEQYSTKEDWKQVEMYVNEILDAQFKASQYVIRMHGTWRVEELMARLLISIWQQDCHYYH